MSNDPTRRRRRRAPRSIDELLAREQDNTERLERLRKRIGRQLRRDRQAAGLYIRQVSEASGVNESDLSLLERGTIYRRHIAERARAAIAQLAVTGPGDPCPAPSRAVS